MKKILIFWLMSLLGFSQTTAVWDVDTATSLAAQIDSDGLMILHLFFV